MKRISTAQIQRNQGLQSDAMDDLCNIIHISLSSGTYSTQGTETHSMISGTPCGIHFTGGQVVERGQTLFVEYDAILRLPAAQSVLLSDEVQLIEKGEFLISGTFNVYSQPTVSSSVQHVPLKRAI
jgi:hypothetical protein